MSMCYTMKSFHIKSGLFALGILGISTYQINANSSGASQPKTGAPNETTCTTCHGGSSLVTSGTQHGRINLKGNYTGGGYIPDSTYTLTVSYAETGKSTFGFQMTALVNGKAAGTFTASTRTGTFSATVAGATRYYVEQNSTGSSSIAKDSTAWTFQWKAPNTNMGEITFYVALNSTNDNGGTSGDVIYNKTFKISPSTLLPKATASIKTKLLCAGATFEFGGSSTNNATGYSWSFPGGTPSTSSLQNPNVSYSTAGSKLAILTSINAKGASLKDTLRFTVLEAAVKPNLNIRTPTVILCLGDTLEFSLGTTARHTYEWRNGATSRSIRIDTAQWISAVATRDNGCSVLTDSVFVIGVPKPIFDVKYGFTTDSVCVNETMIVLLNSRGYTDSYSSVSASGPYNQDSFLIYSIKKGTNSYRFWAKSSVGCFSEPSINRIIVGVDTPSAPQISIFETTSDRIVFSWDNVQNAQSYEYSTDLGKTWSKTDSGLNVRKQYVSLTSATQSVDFWVRARTGNFCTFSHVGKLTAKGSGCTEPKWSLSTNQLISCFDSLVVIKINGLGQLKSYSLQWDQVTFTDSVYSEVLKTDRSYTVSLLDSQQLLCGAFEKSITIKVENSEKPKTFYFPQQEILFCDAVFGATEIPLTIANYQKSNKYHLIDGTTKTPLDSTNFINKSIGNYNWRLTSTTPNGCISLEDTLSIFVDNEANANFDYRWLSDLNYEFAALNQDTMDYVHSWLDSASGNLLSTENKSTITIDYSSVGNTDVTIIHQMRSKRNIDVFGENNCRFELIKSIQIRNLTTHLNALNVTPEFFPNPINRISELLCNGCESSDMIKVWSIDGKQIGTFTLRALQNQNVSKGIYLVRIVNRPNAPLQKIIIGE